MLSEVHAVFGLEVTCFIVYLSADIVNETINIILNSLIVCY